VLIFVIFRSITPTPEVIPLFHKDNTPLEKISRGETLIFRIPNNYPNIAADVS
jgi:hypothetical protein